VEDVGPTGVLALHDHLWPSDETLAGALVFVTATQAQDVALRVGSSGQLHVHVNGTRVLAADELHPLQPDQHVVAVHLQQGVNRVLFKVGQLKGGWTLLARFTAADGGPLNGVTTSVDAALEAARQQVESELNRVTARAYELADRTGSDRS
jgi:hypothetical protein